MRRETRGGGTPEELEAEAELGVDMMEIHCVHL